MNKGSFLFDKQSKGAFRRKWVPSFFEKKGNPSSSETRLLLPMNMFCLTNGTTRRRKPSMFFATIKRQRLESHLVASRMNKGLANS